AVDASPLEAQGVNLFESLFPSNLRDLFWSLPERIRTVFIQSSEPWVPWELCRLTGVEKGRKVEGPFFCEAFALTRWLPGTGIKPSLHLTNLAVVVPDSSALPYAQPEMQYLLGLASPSLQVRRIPARYLELVQALSSGRYDGWHFSGHGAVRGADPNTSEMLLDQQETLTPLRIAGAVTNLGKANPLVFLNACQIGAGGMALTDIGGWARQFLAAGAGAFIGAHWNILDHTAYTFATRLYDLLRAGRPVGEAVREARQQVRPAGDSTWLAYTVFAHPLARVV
ncbi:MAG TPA: CHAT domain-containing protein, partial [Anaerolinea sp.]|nr:CHAT domain-containing protein [Anaerolinea sp.]